MQYSHLRGLKVVPAVALVAERLRELVGQFAEVQPASATTTARDIAGKTTK